MKEFVFAALASENLSKYDSCIRKEFEDVLSGKDNDRCVSLTWILDSRTRFANRIVEEVGLMDANSVDAYEFAHRIVRVIDMTLLKDVPWIDDLDEYAIGHQGGFAMTDGMKSIMEKRDQGWGEVMALAKKYGFIIQAYGGTATLATNINQFNQWGEEKYLELQKGLFGGFERGDA